MPRQMPPLGKKFVWRANDALLLAQAGDLAATQGQTLWHFSRVELLYELAYLKMFMEWERFLEESLLRYLCGYVSPYGMPRPNSGSFCATLASARTALLGGAAYILWYDPNRVATRARRHLVDCPHEAVIASNSTRLIHLAAIRRGCPGIC